MIMKKSFAVIILLLGVFILFIIYKSSLPIIYGTKVKANIIGIDSAKSRRFNYVYYPVFQLKNKNDIIKITDKSSSVNKNLKKSEVTVYYDRNYGLSKVFTVVTTTFLIMGLLMVMLGIVALFTLFKVDQK
ncbi:hypothetical protein J8N07_02125 [Chryseobacterium arthrosphaerae]|uniref:hypothetical protein n=1 Tax=Chryseobacterium arthrosphaerae TaxID=651561 RepID=UPI001E61C15F|nr:hypothetical protein [Chryseobacterium arthrosphaerae]UEQ77125.1 hypothetical protein J8N07_02125 [Chryseobacterium arthrosphaerae]